MTGPDRLSGGAGSSPEVGPGLSVLGSIALPFVWRQRVTTELRLIAVWSDPRYDSTTIGSARTASGSPVAMTPPWSMAMSRSRSEEHTSELQSLMRISYAVFCLKKKRTNKHPSEHILLTRSTLPIL